MPEDVDGPRIAVRLEQRPVAPELGQVRQRGAEMGGGSAEALGSIVRGPQQRGPEPHAGEHAARVRRDDAGVRAVCLQRVRGDRGGHSDQRESEQHALHCRAPGRAGTSDETRSAAGDQTASHEVRAWKKRSAAEYGGG